MRTLQRVHLRENRRPLRLLSVVAVLACVVVGVTGCSSSRPLPPGASFATTVQIRGKDIPYDGTQAWTSASISSRDSRVLTVFAAGSDAVGGGVCGPPVIRFQTHETTTEVRVLVIDYQATSSGPSACNGIGPGPQQVQLQRPLGERKVVDSATGKTQSVIDGTDYPNLIHPPTPFARSVLGRFPGAQWVDRTWQTAGHGAMTLRTQTPASARESGPYGRIVQQLDIGGSPATLYVTGSGQDAQHAVVWTPNPKQTITLRLDNGRRQQWTDAETVAAARSVTGYSSPRTGRLAQPTTPGTAAASYNSADGPVTHAPNLLKSSGVYVGVNCQGAGHVTASLRGTAYTFACTPRLSHHVAKSIGKSFAPFYLDVTASPGVRWAITLARASLDGS